MSRYKSEDERGIEEYEKINRKNIKLNKDLEFTNTNELKDLKNSKKFKKNLQINNILNNNVIPYQDK